MKSVRNLAFSALLTLGAFSAVTYTACNKDECKNVTCNNGGTCVSGTCSCPVGYEGASCDVLTRGRFLSASGGTSTWMGQDVCSVSGTLNITLTIGASSNDVNVLISNPGGFGGTISVTGVVSSTNTLTITNQSVGGNRTMSGTMTFTGGTSTTQPNQMTFAYTVTPALGPADVCNGTYNRQ